MAIRGVGEVSKTKPRFQVFSIANPVKWGKIYRVLHAHRAAGAVFRVYGSCLMQIVSAEEKVALERKREELYKAKIDVTDRIRKALAVNNRCLAGDQQFAVQFCQQIR